MRTLLAVALLAAAPAWAQVSVEKSWARATAPGARVAGGYMLLRNAGTAPDRLLSASSPAALRVETHVHIHEDGVMKMREVQGYEIPANGSFELKPGGAHLMFMEIRKPFVEGEKVPVTLRFEKAGEVKVEFHVGRLTEPSPSKGHGHKH